MYLLKKYEILISGKNAVVVGRSDLVGKPMAFLLLHENATVTMCHSKTADLAGVCARADILVAAMGRPAFITGDFIKPGATVIDVGMNRLQSQEQAEAIFRGPTKRTLVGDVDPIAVAEKAGAYTPVPGGVGLLTVAWLMVNTIESAERRLAGCSA
jgi:methylenetetrahydrofolate dehydrogenase (NADP+)/methenyltetrahydrofolate cyclohydrolase